MTAAAKLAKKRAILLALQTLGGQPRADLGTLAELIASGRRPAPLARDHQVYDWVDEVRCGVRSADAGDRLEAFAELARVVFEAAELQGPQSLPAACLRLLAAVVADLGEQRGGMVSTVVHAVSCEAAGWHPSIDGRASQRGLS